MQSKKPQSLGRLLSTRHTKNARIDHRPRLWWNHCEKMPNEPIKPDLNYVHRHVSRNKGTMHTHGNMRLTSKNKQKKCGKRKATNMDLTTLMCTDMGHWGTRCHRATQTSWKPARKQELLLTHARHHMRDQQLIGKKVKEPSDQDNTAKMNAK